MKIAMIFPYLEAPVGNVSVFLNIALALQKEGNSVDVYCYYFDPKRCFPDLIKNLNVLFVKKVDSSKRNLRINSISNRISAAIDYYFKFPRIFDNMKSKKYDVVYAAEIGSYIPALAYRSLYKKTPSVWSVFDPTTLIDTSKPNSAAKRYPFFKTLLQLHSYYDQSKVRLVDMAIVPTRKMKIKLDKFYGIVSRVFVTAGIDSNIYSKNFKSIIEKRLWEKFKFKKNDEIILFVNAHFQPHRRFEDIVKALGYLVKANNKSYKLIISGSNKFSPEYYQEILKLISDLSLQEYILLDTDFKTNEEIVGYYQYCDIFLFVSVGQTWGLAPFEAMACKKPTILSTGVDCTEVLTDRENSLFVREHSPEDISKKIKILTRDSKLYEKIAVNGYNFTRNNFYYNRIAINLMSLFKELISKYSLSK